MKIPRWFLGLALLFWGWETGLLLWAVLMAVLLEGAHITTTRWEFADKDLNRICDLCLVLFIGAGTILYSTQDRLVFIFKWAQWLPFCFFPVALAQSYGDRDRIALSAFSWILRRMPHSPVARVSFNVSYGYYAVCVLGASASIHADQFFYLGVSILIFLALASVRPNRVSWRAWISLAAVVLLCGRLSHQGLRQLQSTMETALGSWIADWFRTATDLRECPTQIGRAVTPLSSKIVLRLRVPPGELPPPLLREGAYDTYRRGTWMAGTNDFKESRPDGNCVRLLAPKKIFSKVEIAAYFLNGDGLLPMPHGTFKLENFIAGVLTTNRLGVADVQAAPGLLDFQADYWTGPSLDSPPGPNDLLVSDDEIPVMRAVAANLGLDKMTDDRQKIRAVGKFFHDQFHYSLQGPPVSSLANRNTPLGRFLEDYHWGHCEYFATATVLLLRQAGVNARYITGYAVPETARHGENYLVRARHRHAWALVYHNDTTNWEQIDNTPSSWSDTVDASEPWWQGISDFTSNLYFQFSKWRWGGESFSRYFKWALAPLAVYLVWSILSTRRQRNGRGLSSGPMGPAWPGLDSELYLIDRRLTAVHLSRQPNESLSHWQQRLEEAFPASPSLRRIFALHRRLRFDPRGLGSDDRETLRRNAAEWLAEFADSQKPGHGEVLGRPNH